MPLLRSLLQNLLLTWIGIAVSVAFASALSVPINYVIDPAAFRFFWGGGVVSTAALEAHRERVMLFLLLGGLAGLVGAQVVFWRGYVPDRPVSSSPAAAPDRSSPGN
jgi:hypothetical protein